MTTADNRSSDPRRVVFSKDVQISEKRGMSRARDPKTGLLLSGGDSPKQPPEQSRTATPPK